jgi:hypothetical protein
MSTRDKLAGQDSNAVRASVSPRKKSFGTLKFFTINDVAEVLSLSADRRWPAAGAPVRRRGTHRGGILTPPTSLARWRVPKLPKNPNHPSNHFLSRTSRLPFALPLNSPDFGTSRWQLRMEPYIILRAAE